MEKKNQNIIKIIKLIILSIYIETKGTNTVFTLKIVTLEKIIRLLSERNKTVKHNKFFV